MTQSRQSTNQSFGKDYQGAVASLEELAWFAEHTAKCGIASKNQLRRPTH
ncbi:hypothetical protein [Psychromonas arctica]|nr:hypothetical protein [Psychromonas arctica]